MRLRDVRVTREDGTVALEQVSLDVAPGELLAIVGPSGSGKTTLLRAVAGLVKAGGTVELGGRDVTGMTTDRRDLGMVFETGALVSILDVHDNLGLGLRLHHVPKDERNERVDAEAIRLRLGRVLRRKPAGLSAGERARTDIGRALVRRPTAWLLDEPLAHLDPGERFELRHRLVEEVKKQGVATLYVTHDPVEALAVGDRVAVLHQAHLVQVDTPRALYARPLSLFVATLLASQPLGLVTGRLVGAAGLAGVRVGDRTLPFWAGLPAGLEGYEGRDVVLGWRPEDVQDAASVDDPNVARLRGVVVATEFTGPSVLAFVDSTLRRRSARASSSGAAGRSGAPGGPAAARPSGPAGDVPHGGRGRRAGARVRPGDRRRRLAPRGHRTGAVAAGRRRRAPVELTRCGRLRPR